MILGFDGKRATHNKTGLGNYSRDLLNSYSNEYPQDQLIIFSPEKGRFETSLSNHSNVRLYHGSGINKIFPGFWRQFNLVSDLKKSGIELFHGLSHQLPIGLKKNNIRSVVTIHDLIFIRFPELYSFADRNIHLLKVRYACKAAYRIIAISQATKNDLIKYLNIDADKIVVIHPSINSIFNNKLTKEEETKFKNKHGINYKFILCVSTFEKRKNHKIIVEASKTLSNNVKFVLIGKKGDAFNELISLINKYNLSDKFIIKTAVDFSDLVKFYQIAELSIYPSIYEGFGLPALESIACGTPVISTKDTSMEEAAGDGGVYIHAQDHHQLRIEIEKILNNPEYKQQLIQRGLKHAEKFQPQVLIKQINNLYKEILNEGRN